MHYVCMWRSESNFIELVLSFLLYMDSRDQSHLLGLCNKPLYPLSHLTSPSVTLWSLVFQDDQPSLSSIPNIIESSKPWQYFLRSLPHLREIRYPRWEVGGLPIPKDITCLHLPVPELFSSWQNTVPSLPSLPTVLISSNPQTVSLLISSSPTLVFWTF